MSKDEEIDNIFKILRKFVRNLSPGKCRAVFLSFRVKIALILFYALNSIVLLRIRLRAFKILADFLDVLLVFKENAQDLLQILDNSLEFLGGKPHLQQNFSINSLIADGKLEKTIASEIYGEWVKQIQDKTPVSSVSDGKILRVAAKKP